MSTVTQSEAASRYKSAGAKFGTQPSAVEIQKVYTEVKASFRAGVPTPLAFRIQQLKALKQLLIKEKQAISNALYLDLHKNEFDSFVTEIQPTLSEIDHTIEHLAEWMKPTQKNQTAMVSHSWNSTVPDPLGCVLIFGSWNYPVFLLIGPLIGAIAGGNCVVLKPGSYAKHSSNVIVNLIPKYLDPRCVKAMEGNREVTNALLDLKWDKIFFTGSGFVGKKIAIKAAEHLTPVVLELGGKSPAIVDASSDPLLAAERIAWGAFLNAGQTCVRPDFMLLHESIADKVIDKMKVFLQKMFTANAADSPNFGRLINDGAFNRLSDLVNTHKSNIVFGGAFEKDNGKDKNYVEPTLLDFGNDLKAFSEAKVMQDEIFGPILPFCRYSKLEDVLDFVNDLPTGKPLALYAFAKDAKVVDTIKFKTTSGGMCVNDVLVHLVNHYLPFGGVGNSGMGSYHGKYSFACFTHEKACLEKSQALDTLPGMKDVLAVRYPPFNSVSEKIINSFGSPLVNKVVASLFHLDLKDLSLKFILFYILLRLAGFRVSK